MDVCIFSLHKELGNIVQAMEKGQGIYIGRREGIGICTTMVRE